MKSYILAPIVLRKSATAALSAALPGQTETWLLKDSTGDVIAYFYVTEPDGMSMDRMIVADISGRHYNQDAEVVAVLQKLKATVGGEIIYEP